MYVCLSVSVCLCLSLSVSVCLCLCLSLSVSVCLCLSVSVCLSVRTYACMHACNACMYVCMYLCLYVCVMWILVCATWASSRWASSRSYEAPRGGRASAISSKVATIRAMARMAPKNYGHDTKQLTLRAVVKCSGIVVEGIGGMGMGWWMMDDGWWMMGASWPVLLDQKLQPKLSVFLNVWSSKSSLSLPLLESPSMTAPTFERLGWPSPPPVAHEIPWWFLKVYKWQAHGAPLSKMNGATIKN